jgi:hypothetical protein
MMAVANSDFSSWVAPLDETMEFVLSALVAQPPFPIWIPDATAFSERLHRFPFIRYSSLGAIAFSYRKLPS